MARDLPQWRARLIAAHVREGAVIAYPTEGVWGLGCLPADVDAVARILDLKDRDWRQGLILVAGDMDQVEPYLAGLTGPERATLMAHWPGPVTFLVPDNGVAPEWIRGQHNTLAIRVSDHPVVRALCAELGAIVSTSANPSGRAAARTALRVRQYFPEGVDHVVPGTIGNAGGASEIRELRTGIVRRPGAGA